MDRYGIKDKDERFLGILEISKINREVLKISKICLAEDERTTRNGEEILKFLANEYSVKYFLIEGDNFWIGGNLVLLKIHNGERIALIKI